MPSEYIEMDAEMLNKAIHVLKGITYDLYKEKNCDIILSENHVVGHIKWAVELLYNAIK